MVNLEFNWSNIASNTNYQQKAQKDYKDDRFWTLSKDENGKGAAIIRLLIDKDSTPFVSLLNCGLKAYSEKDKKYYWYIRNLPSSIGEKDPLNELWGVLYNHSNAGAEEARKFSRKETFITNILVVKDPAHPENNGKVFLWKFGKKLLDKFMSALNPSEQERELGETPKELYNPLEGNNIALKIKNVSGFPNYDDTTILEKSSVFKTEQEAIDTIENKTHALSEFCNPDYFDSYEDLKKDLINFCKKYKPQHLSQQEFNTCVSEALEVEINTKEKEKPSYRQEVEKDPDEDFEKVWKDEEPKKTQETKKDNKENTKKTQASNDLDDLDDLLDELM